MILYPYGEYCYNILDLWRKNLFNKSNCIYIYVYCIRTILSKHSYQFRWFVRLKLRSLRNYYRYTKLVTSVRTNRPKYVGLVDLFYFNSNINQYYLIIIIVPHYDLLFCLDNTISHNTVIQLGRPFEIETRS